MTLLEIVAERDRKSRAGQILNKAIKEGRMERGNCQVCGRTSGKWGELIQGHHCDYAEPLEVIWLCCACHKLLHANLKRRGLGLSDSKRALLSLTWSKAKQYKRARAKKKLWGIV